MKNIAWLKEIFQNKLIILGIIILIVLSYYFKESEGNIKLTILIWVGIIIIMLFLFQWLDNKNNKKAEKKVISEAEDDEKNLLRTYIGWNEELKTFFKNFIPTKVLFCEIDEDNKIINLRTHLDRDMKKLRKSLKYDANAIYISSMMVNNEMNKVNTLIREGIIKKRNPHSGDPFTFKLILTNAGGKLIENIEKINQLSE